jgi:hypothetical protein
LTLKNLAKHIICLIHWIYKCRKDFRQTIRNQIGRTLIMRGGHSGLRRDAGVGPGAHAHVATLLEVIENSK